MLVLIIVGVAGILFLILNGSDKSENNKEEQEENEQKQQEDEQKQQGDEQKQEQQPEIDKNSKEVEEYYNIYKMEYTFDKRYLDGLNSNNIEEIEKAKFYIAYKQIKAEEIETVKCGDFTDINYHDSYCGKMNEEMQKYYTDKSKFKEAESKNNTTAFKGETLKNNYEKIFGKGTFTKYIEYIGTSPSGGYYYSSNKDMYVNSNFEGGGYEYAISQELEQALKVENKLVLIIKSSIESEDEQFDDEKIKITLKYEKETGNYIFESREVVTK